MFWNVRFDCFFTIFLYRNLILILVLTVDSFWVKFRNQEIKKMWDRRTVWINSSWCFDTAGWYLQSTLVDSESACRTVWISIVNYANKISAQLKRFENATETMQKKEYQVYGATFCTWLDDGKSEYGVVLGDKENLKTVYFAETRRFGYIFSVIFFLSI